MKPCLLLLAFWGTPVLATALEGEVTGSVERALVTVATPAGNQETGIDRVRGEVWASQKFAASGWSLESSGVVGLDTLPSGNPRDLPSRKVEPSASLLEGWLGWEPIPGTLSLGAGKRGLASSSGFSHKPLDEVSKPDSREGRTGFQAAWFGDSWSASAFAAPEWKGETDQAFVLVRAGASLGALDTRWQVVQRSGPPRAGAGLDTSWGDHLTLRAEIAADARPESPRLDSLVGATWTESEATVMAEASWNDRGSQPWASVFLRTAADLDDHVSAELWTRTDVQPTRSTDLSGWTGTKLTWTADRWSLSGAWQTAWGSPGTPAGDTPLRWKVVVESKVFW